MKDFIVVIPARMQSTRLPGKPLIDLNGKSMLLRTYLQCAKAVDSSLIYVATDDEQIVQHCIKNDMQVLLTSSKHLTGTDRVAEVSESIEAKYYINVQGDEPLFNPDDIKKVIEGLQTYQGDIINGYTEIHTEDLFNSLSIPKVVFRPDKRLLYMSRSPIPGNKNGLFKRSWRQVCIYAFPSEALTEFSVRKEKTPLEEEEDIEILRFLELGYEVRMMELSNTSVPVDTKEDAEKVKRLLRNAEK